MTVLYGQFNRVVHKLDSHKCGSLTPFCFKIRHTNNARADIFRFIIFLAAGTFLSNKMLLEFTALITV